MSNALPPPDAESSAHGKKVVEHIKDVIKKNGPLSFAAFQHLALYAPELGYYSAGSTKFGRAGDFITAPELSALFSKSLSEQCQQVLKTLPNASILELGAGTGKMASDILSSLHAVDLLPQHYFILEPSAELQARQRQHFEQTIPTLLDRVVWLSTLPSDFKGIILANEVIDAMPVHRFHWDHGTLHEYYVTLNDGAFIEVEQTPSSAHLTQAVSALNLDPDSDYQSEINLALNDWINQLAQCLTQGVIVLIDYGFSQREYYHPQRNRGTLMCHYRHRAHDNPYTRIGLQDITSHVDFTAVAKAGAHATLELLGYTTQAYFLLNCDIIKLFEAEKSADKTDQYTLTQQLKMLTLPHEMGELFKVMALGKKWEQPLIGFQSFDQRRKL